MCGSQPQMQHLSDFSGILRAARGEEALWRHHITHSTADVLKRAPKASSLPGSPNLKVRCTVLCVDSSVQRYPVCLLA